MGGGLGCWGDGLVGPFGFSWGWGGGSINAGEESANTALEEGRMCELLITW